MNKTFDLSQPSEALTENERIARLRLIRSQNVGPITFRQLLGRFGTAQKALEALPELARRGGRAKRIALPSLAAAQREFEQADALGGTVVVLGEAGYPAPLAAIEDAPPVLFVLGHKHLLSKTMLGIVGARNASAAGVRFAKQIAGELGAQDLVVVSGLARGIDTAAHAGALATGTVAVQAGGVDVIYPPENANLHREIAEAGVVISEMACGTRPQARHFPRRNRIISGLSLGILVIEAAPRSGSLITARLALEQGREVFAVPGSPLDPRCRGVNNLIRQGAVLTESADDVMQVMSTLRRQPLREPLDLHVAPRLPGLDDPRELEDARRILREKLSPTPIYVDELVRQCKLTPGAVLTILLELELAGGLQRHPGNQVSLV
ncbi:MAG: DNA-processing protein DprA [Sphingomonadales bacterium]